MLIRIVLILLDSSQIDLMHDVISLAQVNALAELALVAYASMTGVQLVVSHLLLEGVVDVLLLIVGHRVARWLGDRVLVIFVLLVVPILCLILVLNLLVFAISYERTAKHWVAATGAHHLELGRLVGGCLRLTRWPLVNVCIGVCINSKITSIGSVLLCLGQAPVISMIVCVGV